MDKRTREVWDKIIADEENEAERTLEEVLALGVIERSLEERNMLIDTGASFDEILDMHHDPYILNEYCYSPLEEGWGVIDMQYEDENGVISERDKKMLEIKKERARMIYDGNDPGPLDYWKDELNKPKKEPRKVDENGIPIIFDFVPSKKPFRKRENRQSVQQQEYDYWEEEERKRQQIILEEEMYEEEEQERLRREEEEREAREDFERLILYWQDEENEENY